MSRINIYMPAYEAKKEHIQPAIDSVLAQNFKDWTLLIQDDYSQQEAVQEHIRSYLTDKRVTFRRNQQNVGIGPNWNACLDFGDAPYIAYLFHDDLWKPEYLAKALEVLDANPDVGFVSLGHSYLKEDGVVDTAIYDEVEQCIQKNITSGKHNGQELLLWWAEHGLRPNIIGEPSFVVLRRELMQKVGKFHETMPQFLDSEYWIRCLLQTNWYFVDEDLGSFRVHPSAASAQNATAGRGAFDRFDCFQMLIRKMPKQKKPEVKRAFEKAFDDMVAKFFAKKRSGLKVSAKGSGGMKKFALRHPFMVSKAILRYIFE